MVSVNHTRRDISFTSAVKFGVETCVENFIRIEFKTRFVSPAPTSSPAPVFGTKLRSGCSLAGGDPLRLNPQQLVVRQRLAYTLVGLLLGYSLMSLVDLIDSAVAWAGSSRRRRDADAAPPDAAPASVADVVRQWGALAGWSLARKAKVVTVNVAKSVSPQ